MLQTLQSSFPHTPTADQLAMMKVFVKFMEEKGYNHQTFLLKGYAGTGKTTSVAAIVSCARKLKINVVLLAPTGRAAKVITQYAGKTAYTIHRYIYRKSVNSATGNIQFVLQKNKAVNTLYIVDEASMIGSDNETGDLLEDVINFVFEGNNNRLMLVGDTAQLPPVGQSISPALDKDKLKAKFLEVHEVELKEVVRQQKASGILYNATLLRSLLEKNSIDIQLHTKGFYDCFSMTTEKIEDGLRYAHKKFGEEDTIVITRSNKGAVSYNNYIRRFIRFAEDEIEAGDVLMVVKNNYTILPEDAPVSFIANGDTIEIRKIRKFEEMHGFRFANIEFAMPDYPTLPVQEAKIILDTLQSDTPALSRDQNQALYQAVANDYADIKIKADRMDMIRKDPYLTALQVKFAYAITCHKAQGGQWKAVFVDQGYLTEDTVNKDFVRWLYTAITRSNGELFLMNFEGKFLA